MATLSAGVNFGYPNTDFIIESDEHGVAQSCRNVDTGIEYVGGGGGGASTLYITSNNGYIAETYNELKEYFDTGYLIFFTKTVTNGNTTTKSVMPLCGFVESDGWYYVNFLYHNPSTGVISNYSIYAEGADTPMTVNE